MSDTDNLDAVMRRVRKLLAIAEDSRGDPNECAAAARMAESVMRKYQIEHADVVAREIREGRDAFSTVDVGCTMDLGAHDVSKSAGWSGILAVKVAQLHDCQVRFERCPPHGKVLRFAGYSADVKMCKFTYEFIVNSMVAASRLYTRGMGRTRGEAESYRRGYLSAVGRSLAQLRAEKGAEMQRASASRALVIVKAAAVAEHFGACKYRAGRGYSTSSGTAFADGYERGKALDVGRRGIAGGSDATRIAS